MRKIPYVNFLILCGIVIMYGITITRKDPDLFIFKWSVIPFLVDSNHRYASLLGLFSLLLNTSLPQVLLSVVYLKIFGDLVEDHLGHLLYLVLYFAGGWIGLLTQLTFLTHRNLPLNGSPAAVSSVIGFYLIYHWKDSLNVQLPRIGLKSVKLPVWTIVVLWFLGYFTYSFLSVGSIQYSLEVTRWISLAGGFVFGTGIGLLLRPFLEAEMI
jgi:membrane associated rhomboid family serine protease